MCQIHPGKINTLYQEIKYTEQERLKWSKCAPEARESGVGAAPLSHFLREDKLCSAEAENIKRGDSTGSLDC